MMKRGQERGAESCVRVVAYGERSRLYCAVSTMTGRNVWHQGALPTCVLWKDLGDVCLFCESVWSGEKDLTSSLSKETVWNCRQKRSIEAEKKISLHYR